MYMNENGIVNLAVPFLSPIGSVLPPVKNTCAVQYGTV